MKTRPPTNPLQMRRVSTPKVRAQSTQKSIQQLRTAFEHLQAFFKERPGFESDLVAGFMHSWLYNKSTEKLNTQLDLLAYLMNAQRDDPACSPLDALVTYGAKLREPATAKVFNFKAAEVR